MVRIHLGEYTYSKDLAELLPLQQESKKTLENSKLALAIFQVTQRNQNKTRKSIDRIIRNIRSLPNAYIKYHVRIDDFVYLNIIKFKKMIDAIGNIWNNLIEWFNDRSDRNLLIRNFNKMAQEAFVYGIAPTLLKASVSKGVHGYRHEFSNWMYTGFRIQALAGRVLSKDEMLTIGQVVLADTPLVRRLIALGWDTLEVHDDTGIYGCRWKLIDYAHIGLMLNQNNI